MTTEKKARSKLYHPGLFARWWLGLLLILAIWVGFLDRAPAASHKIETVAGTGEPGYSGDGGPALKAQFLYPRGMTVDKAGNLYIADTENHRVRKVDVKADYITTFVGCEKGKDKVCEKWDNWVINRDETEIQATQLQLNMPSDVAIDNAGNLYILDHVGYRVYKVDTKGVIKAFAGNGTYGYSGDGGLATKASINPTFGGISVDNQGNLYLADRTNHRIRKVDSNGIITTIAGNGSAGYSGNGGQATEAQLNLPEDMVVDKNGNLYIADSYNRVIRQVDTAGIITTLAGTGEKKKYSGDGGLATEATFHLPTDVLVDNSGNLFIIDQMDHRVLHIDKEGIIRSIAGNRELGYSADEGDATQALLNHPGKISFVKEPHNEDSFIELYISDINNHCIRKITWVEEDKDKDKDKDIFWIILLVLSSLILLGTGIVVYYLRLYRHPIVQALSADTSRLLTTTQLEQLAQTKRLLQRTHLLDTVLVNNEVPVEWLDNAIHFTTMSNAQRAALLAQRLIATAKATENADIFMLKLGEAFPLNLSRCQIFFPPANWPVEDVVMQLQQDEMLFQNVLVISLEASQQKMLRPHGEDISTRWLVPNSRELTELLLSPEPTQVFVRLLANQLKVTNLSPYQTRGGVTKDSSFFGREKILAQILNREPMNYLIIGGRQLGKSSLLKRIERHYQNHPKVDCFYLALRKANLQQVNLKFGLAKDAPLPTLLETLAEVPTDKRRLLLLDETDLFIREEIANDYPTLSRFRNLSEQGHCHFILAGFWDLYEAAVLDYHSPIVNFGETLTIGALEEEACRQLATEPMAMLGIRYASDELIEQILTATGRRANLVATACDDMLQNLPTDRRELNQQDVTRALHSDAMGQAMAAWKKVCNDDKEMARLVYIIVYATVEQGEMTTTDVMEVLNAHQQSYTPEQLRQSLERLESEKGQLTVTDVMALLNARQSVYTDEQLEQSLTRLELAYIIQRETHENGKTRYRYCVSLFREWLLRQDVKALLEQEFRG
jgi:sugar lactone lactonase YvrE